MSSNVIDQGVCIDTRTVTNTFTVTLLDVCKRYSLRIERKDITAVQKACGLKFPRKIGKTLIAKGVTILCLGPEEWLLIQVGVDETLGRKLFDFTSICDFSVVDVSHRNIGFVLTGAEAANVVNIGCPLDLSLQAFPIGKAVRTVFEDAPIVLMRKGESEFLLEVWRSFAPYVNTFFLRYVNQA